MRDYIVLWNRPEVSGVKTWYADDPGNIPYPNVPDEQLISERVYVRIPNEKLLLDAFNKGKGFLNDCSIKLDSATYSFHEGWGRLFGATTPGGYSKLSDVPTSDAIGALFGRPARDPETGRFVSP
jgi:hypothetical protein